MIINAALKKKGAERFISIIIIILARRNRKINIVSLRILEGVEKISVLYNAMVVK
jgi:hypothetical protein